MNLQKAQELALDLMQEHQLNKWVFQFDRAKVRFGYCNYRDKIISLSKHLVELNSKALVKDTILHEVAHALVGKRHNHGKVWKEKAFEIGCSATRCYSEKDVVIPLKKYTASCGSCKRVFQAARKRKAACGICCKRYNNNKFSKEFLISFTLNEFS
jgi:predicted SprT family Zn-dependent metalloprotease